MKSESTARRLPQPLERPAPKPRDEKLARPKIVELPSELLEDDDVEINLDDLQEIREPGELQESDVVDAFEVNGFKGLEVYATLEKKNVSKAEDKEPGGNEDNILTDAETGLIGVMDGLGGVKNGRLASRSAESHIPSHYATALNASKKMNTRQVLQALVEAQIRRLESSALRPQITKQIEDVMEQDPEMGRKALALIEAFKATNTDVKETGGMTTACIGFVHQAPNGEKWAVVANMGDSAAFKRRTNGEMVPLTKEDSLLNQLQERGLLNEVTLRAMKRNPKAEIFPLYGKTLSYEFMKRAMSASLGHDKEAIPSLSIRKLEPGDELVFMTDGVVDKYDNPTTDEISLTEMAQDFDMENDTKERLNWFRNLAKVKREVEGQKTLKKDDDIAIVVAKVL